jgi:hypothetical protein
MRALVAAAHYSRRRVLLLAPTGKAVDAAVWESAGDTGYTVAKALIFLQVESAVLNWPFGSTAPGRKRQLPRVTPIPVTSA